MTARRLPPRKHRGPASWMRANLFATPFDAALTLLIVWALYAFASSAGGWLLFDAVIDADSRAACAAKGSGACWAVIAARFDQFVFGFYPAGERWRPVLAFLLLAPALAPVLARGVPFRRPLLGFACAYPLLAGWLIHGGWLLPEVGTKLYGGFLLTLIIGVTGIAASLPLGVALALGRRSRMPALRVLSAGFIEFARGVPLIALLFVASTMLKYFLPPGTSFDLLVRVLIMVSLFAAAYIAEVVRGGLQSVPRAQEEAAAALGLTRRQTLQYVVLPQALRISIPGIVNVFIGLFKDSTLVIVIGLLDPLGIARAAAADPKWNGLSTELYLFVALFFFVCCFAMSRYSLRLERRLAAGAERR